MSETMRIPKPVGMRGARVMVPNYRRGGFQESGEIVKATYDPTYGWSYDVLLDRRSLRFGTCLWLYVSDHFNKPSRLGRGGAS